MDDPEVWRWVWLVAAATFGAAEIATAGTFFSLPFAVGAIVAAVVSFAGVPVAVGWLVFALVSAASFGAFRPIARRLDRSTAGQLGVGAERWAGREGVVVRAIPGGPGGAGAVRIEREEWRAESLTGAPIEEGCAVFVSRVEGTRLIVVPSGPHE